MIKVVKFYKPVLLDPGASEEWVIEDHMEGVKFVFLPLLRIYNEQSVCHLTVTHIFDLGWGDDPLWSGTSTTVLVDEDIPPTSIRDFEFTPQLDRDQKIRTYHKVKITNLDPTETRVIKTLVYGLTETMVQTSGAGGVISTQVPTV